MQHVEWVILNKSHFFPYVTCPGQHIWSTHQKLHKTTGDAMLKEVYPAASRFWRVQRICEIKKTFLTDFWSLTILNNYIKYVVFVVLLQGHTFMIFVKKKKVYCAFCLSTYSMWQDILKSTIPICSSLYFHSQQCRHSEISTHKVRHLCQALVYLKSARGLDDDFYIWRIHAMFLTWKRLGVEGVET